MKTKVIHNTAAVFTILTGSMRVAGGVMLLIRRELSAADLPVVADSQQTRFVAIGLVLISILLCYPGCNCCL